ncbi:cytochrome P450 [Burkholderia sp. H160]|nr:cytochrome P450 [Burkholderia sp. H160]
MSNASTAVLPSHVPPELVRPYPLMGQRTISDNPYSTVIPEVHEGPAVFYTVDGYHGLHPMWVFRKYGDVQTIYADTEHFTSKDFAPFAPLTNQTWNLVPAESDPPLHALHRQIVNPLFTPKRMAGLEQQVREVARAAVARFKDKGECDFMAEMAFEFPIVVFLQLMGLPVEGLSRFLAWERKLTHPDSIEEIIEGTMQVTEFLREVIADRKRNPVDDFISYGIQAEVGGRKLTDDELIGFCFNLFVGGLDTVSTNMGWHFRHLAEHPEHQRELRRDPTKIPMAIEELLRAYSAVTTNRKCVKPVQIGGVQLMPGDIVALSTPLANRDPEIFPEPNVVKLDRNPRHTAFATGIHRCVGAPLARRELIIAMEEMLSVLPEFRIKPRAVLQTCMGPIMQPTALPLVWNV